MHGENLKLNEIKTKAIYLLMRLAQDVAVLSSIGTGPVTISTNNLAALTDDFREFTKFRNEVSETVAQTEP